VEEGWLKGLVDDLFYHRYTMTYVFRLSLIILGLLTISSFGKPKALSDTLYQRLDKTPVSQMSDSEYEYFVYIRRRCCSDSLCHDFQLHEIVANKPTIASMTINEARYFDNMVYECDSINPCKLPQFADLLSKDSTKMSHEEYYQFTELVEHCDSYTDKHFPTKKHLRKRHRRAAVFMILCYVLGAFFVSFVVYAIEHPTHEF
jgi:hypothetical protein